MDWYNIGNRSVKRSFPCQRLKIHETGVNTMRKRSLVSALAALTLLALASCAAEPLKPCETDRHGFDGEVCYVQMDGDTYCYNVSAPGESGLTADEVVDTFSMETGLEGIEWEIRTTREHPDGSVLLAISGTNSVWTLEYAGEDASGTGSP